VKHIINNGKISKLEGGESGETFLVKYSGKKFVLRRYQTKKEADYYVSVYNKLKKYGFLPDLYFHEDKDILMEYISGRDCKKSDALKVAEQVGRICALISKLKIRSIFNKNKPLEPLLDIMKIKGIIGESSSQSLIKEYYGLKKRVKPKLSIDYDDVHPQNFRLRNGRVYLVDLEEFDLNFKGAGIAKSFLRWFKTDFERKNFLRGYAEISSPDFLTQDYLKFLYLRFTIYIVAYKIKKNLDINPNDLDRLFRFINGKEVNK